MMRSVRDHVILKKKKKKKKKNNSVSLVRERTIPTERPLLVTEVITNFCGQRVSRAILTLNLVLKPISCCILGMLYGRSLHSCYNCTCTWSHLHDLSAIFIACLIVSLHMPCSQTCITCYERATAKIPVRYELND
jgi:hypothetical protein